MESHVVDAGGPIHYVDYGGAGSPMVLVHGLGGSHANWMAVGPALARRHRVVAVDLPGFGLTPLGDRTTRLAASAEAIGAFIDAVATPPVILVGNSMGGMLCTMVAASSPRRVGALVLVNAVHPPAFGVRLDLEVTLMFTTYLIPWLGEQITRAHAVRMAPETLVKRVMRLCGLDPRDADPEILAAHVAIEQERRRMGWSHEAFLVATRSIVRELAAPRRLRRVAAQVQAPTLLVHGDRDRLVPVGMARAVSKRLGWALEEMRGVGHVPQLHAPDAFVRIVEGWLERVGPIA